MRTTSHEEDVARRGLRTDLPGPSVVRVDDDSAPGAPNLKSSASRVSARVEWFGPLAKRQRLNQPSGFWEASR